LREGITMQTLRCGAVALMLACVLSACHSIPKSQIEATAPVQPGVNEMVEVNDLYIIVDASGSMYPPDEFRLAVRMLRAFVNAMPEEYYGTEFMTFGGEWEMDWLRMPIATFDRNKLKAAVEEVKWLGGSTPLADALSQLGPTLQDRHTHSAMLILSDGQSDPESSLAAARALLSAHPGTLCFHTVHMGSELQGRDVMEQIAGLTACGTMRNASAVTAANGIETLVRDIFFGGLLDHDQDGVPDPRDLCPDSRPGAVVNAYGCESWARVDFDSDKAAVQRRFKDDLDAVAARLQANPGVCLRVEGHADGRNEVEYNQRLSERRANAVRDALVQRGVNPGQLLVNAYSELRPAAPNTSAHNMQLNRRVELMPLP